MAKEIKRLSEFGKQALQESEIIGNKLFLKIQMDRKQYVELNKILELLGGKRNRKEKCHIFNIDNLQEAIDEVCDTMEVVDLKVLYQQFYTPQTLAKRLVELADFKKDDVVLEPSAGQGSIVDEIPREIGELFLIEIDEKNCEYLKTIGYEPNKGDFLEYNVEGFDKIIMNPPFTKSQDVKHILHAYSLLKKGGRIVSIASSSIQDRSGKLYDKLKELHPQYIEIEDGAFKESGTMVSSVIVIIDKK